MRRTKILVALVLAVFMAAFATTASAASMPAGAVLHITPGVGASGTTPCSVGSCFSMNNGGLVWTNFGPGTDGGVILGVDQATGGQEYDGSIVDPGSLSASWNFFNSNGCFGTTPMCAPDTATVGCATTTSASNVFSMTSCANAAACLGNTTLGTWHVGWNGVAVPMGSALGCAAVPTTNCVGVSSWTLTPSPAINGGSYELIYNWAVPAGDPSGFGNVPFGLIMRGTISGLPTNPCTGVVCTALDQCHDVGVCNTSTGICSNPNKTDGTACDDSNLCTTGEVCTGGVCGGGTLKVCTGTNTCKNYGTCIPSTGNCPTATNKTVGTACDDGNACTLNDVCAAGGVCKGTTNFCRDTDPCTEDACTAGTGVCTHTPVGTPGVCGVACATPVPTDWKLLITPGQGSGTNVPCSVGSCFSMVNGSDIIWTDILPGTDGGFWVGHPQASGGQELAGGGSVSTNGALTAAWNFFNAEGTFYTSPDGGSLNKYCETGCSGYDCINKTELKVFTVAWNGGPILMGSAAGCVLSNCSIQQNNDVMVNNWTITPTNGGAWSMDYAQVVPVGSFSNVNFKAILRGTVDSGNPCAGVNCTALDNCHDIGVCDTTTGICSNPNKSNGTSCDDGNLCNGIETCQSGVCTAGTAVTCPDATACTTVGACVPSTGLCPVTNKSNGTNCDDGNLCNGIETCQSGVCTAGTAVTCPAATACTTVGACVPSTGICPVTNKSNGTTCDDGNPCTVGDSCQNGACQSGPGVTCAPATACKEAEACSGGVCQPAVNKFNGTACDDGNACTTGDTCQNGACASGTAVVCAADGNPCTTDVCNTATGLCDHTAIAGCPGDGSPLSCTVLGIDPGNSDGATECTSGSCFAMDMGPMGKAWTNIAAGSDGGFVTGKDQDVGELTDVWSFFNADGWFITKPGGTTNVFNNQSCSGAQCYTKTVINVLTAFWNNNPIPMGSANGCNSVMCSPAQKDGIFVSDYQYNGIGNSWSMTYNQVVPDAVPGFGGVVFTLVVRGTASDNLCCNKVCTPSSSCVTSACDMASGSCVESPVANGTACSDGNACTTGDSCQNGVCTGGAAVVCPVATACTTVGACNPATGVCPVTNKSDGTSCDDGNACTTGDSCQNGACTGTAVICPAATACMNASVCDAADGCLPATPKSNGTACDDGNACTTGDTCQNGACASGTAVVCAADGNPCTTDVCNTATGLCDHTAIAGCPGDGSPLSCTVLGIDPGNSDGATECTSGSCFAMDMGPMGKAWTNIAAGSDGGFVTGKDQDVGELTDVWSFFNANGWFITKPGGTTNVFNNQSCSGAQCYTKTVINVLTAFWNNNPIPMGSANGCNSVMCSPAQKDGIFVSDYQYNGIGNPWSMTYNQVVPDAVPGFGGVIFTLVVRGTASDNLCCNKVCTPSSSCVTSACDMASGSCVESPVANGTACSDGNACTTGDSCQNGVCTGGAAVVCPAATACTTVGACVPSTGICPVTNKSNGTNCDDGNLCNGIETCQSGVCTAGTAVVCPAATTCTTVGACIPSTGVCPVTNKSNGTSCDDNNACTTGEVCTGGVCGGGTAVVCAALDQCHLAGVCDTVTGCSNPNKSNGSSCDDGNACTSGEVCTGGVCGGGTAVVCTALDQCHNAGACNTSTGICSNPNRADNTACNDNNACTTNDVCTAGVCSGTAVVCTALDQCHNAGACTAGVCSNPNKADGTACNDGNLCTTNDVCTAGVCGGTAKNCNDNNACTADSCDTATGNCVNAAINCNDNDPCTADSCNPATGCVHTPIACNDGDLDGVGGVTVSDALLALRIAEGIVTPTASQLTHGDVAPLVNGISHPDGIINIGDVVVILRRAVGLIQSW